MEDIKFRVWNGMEMVHDVTVGKFGVFYVNPTNNGLDLNDSASLTPFTTKYSDTTPVMQYTGCKDKNGKEIYEGDILTSYPNLKRGTPNYAPVIFDHGAFLWRDIPLGFDEENVAEPVGTEWAVVAGNIYENPELVKKG